MLARAQKGQTVGIDFSIGMAIFVITVAAAIFFTNSIVMPSSPFNTQVQKSAQQAADRFFDTAGWDVKATPILLDAQVAADSYPVETPFLLAPEADRNATLVMHGTNEVVSQSSPARNETVFLADLNSRRDYRIISIDNAGLEDRDYRPQVRRSGDTIWNNRTNLTLDSDGIDSLLYNGSERMVINTDLNATDTTPFYRDGPVRVLARYNSSDLLELRMFGRTDRVRIFHNASGTEVYRFNLSADFDWVHHTGGASPLDGSGTHFTGETDVLDFIDNSTASTYGLAIVGQGMDGFVYRNGTGTLLVNATYSGERLLVLPHSDGHTAITAEQQLFLDPPRILPLVTATKEGLSRREMQRLDDTGDDAIRQQLALGGLGYNLSVNTTFNAGEPIPSAQAVAVLSYPAAVLDRFGNTTLQQFRMAVWLQ